MKKRTCVLGVAALLAALLALSGVAQSAMWVGAQIGGNWNNATIDASVGNLSASAPLQVKPSVIGGVTLGYDFVNSGFAGYNYPSWMQYFSFAVDFTYNRLDVDAGTGARRILAPNSRLNGYEAALTFLFMAHYGFLRDSEVPTGRINPYIGVGPAVVFSGGDFTLSTPENLLVKGRVTTSHVGTNATNVALVVEPGIRWMAFKNVSIDTAFRYRYSVPNWSDDIATLKVTLHQFAFLLRANYHF